MKNKSRITVQKVFLRRFGYYHTIIINIIQTNHSIRKTVLEFEIDHGLIYEMLLEFVFSKIFCSTFN